MLRIFLKKIDAILYYSFEKNGIKSSKNLAAVVDLSPILLADSALHLLILGSSFSTYYSVLYGSGNNALGTKYGVSGIKPAIIFNVYIKVFNN